jgi:hypothetical protein
VAIDREEPVGRFSVSHLDANVGHGGANWTSVFDTLEQAMAASEAVWGPERFNVRQEINDPETGERWSRADGQPTWNHTAEE